MRLEHKRMLVAYLNHAFASPVMLATTVEHWPDAARREPDLLDWRVLVIGWEDGHNKARGMPTVRNAEKRRKHNRERKARRARARR